MLRMELVFCFVVALTVINGKIAPKGDLQSDAAVASSTVPRDNDDEETTFLHGLEFQHAITGQDYLIKCKVEGNPIPVVVWRKNDSVITTNDRYVVHIKGLLIKKVTKSDDGVYTCKTLDHVAGGLKEKNFKLEVSIPSTTERKVPESIPQVKKLSITATTVTWKIDPPVPDVLAIRTLLVRYRPDEEMSWDLAKNHTWPFDSLEDDPSYVLKDLVPKTTYHFQFAASNDVGWGPFTDALAITLPPTGPPEKPQMYAPEHYTKENTNATEDVRAVSPYQYYFQIEWHVPDDNGVPIDSYYIRYGVSQKINGSWRNDECSEEISLSQNDTSYNFDSVKGDTIYYIELRAHNSLGFSLPAQIRMKTNKL